MRPTPLLLLLASAALLPAADTPPPRICGAVAAERLVVDFTRTGLRHTETGATLAWNEGARVTFGEPGGGVRILAPKMGCDLTDAVILTAEIRNLGDRPLSLLGEINRNESSRGFLHLPPRGKGTLALHLMRLEKDRPEPDPFPGMRGAPGGFMQHWDRACDSQVLRFLTLSDLDGTAVGQSVVISALHARGRFGEIPPPGTAAFFPFVDAFGQYKHGSWPGKTRSAADLKRCRESEAGDLAAHPGPAEWSRYGGWKGGPKLEASGHFRTARHDGKWWLVDPDGYLFWSHGVTGVGVGSRTPVEGRRHFFESIPKAHLQDKTVDFLQANLELKYGGSWSTESLATAHQRLRSWGMNSAGNWSDETLCAMRRTPYFVPIHYPWTYGDPRRDPEALRRVLEERIKHDTRREDPWCVGYFVDNELDWNEMMDPELYYRTVSEVMKRLAPNKLYLGSRLHGPKSVHGGPEKAALAAARYCDVVSINRYRFSPSDLRLPEGTDKPILIGEFHFGALDRGMFHPGLRGVGDQQQRAHAYRHYVEAALAHPNIVGTHWFQYREQAVTGRGDGENFQIGFVDIADTPSAELIEASRRIGERLYAIRSGKEP